MMLMCDFKDILSTGRTFNIANIDNPLYYEYSAHGGYRYNMSFVDGHVEPKTMANIIEMWNASAPGNYVSHGNEVFLYK